MKRIDDERLRDIHDSARGNNEAKQAAAIVTCGELEALTLEVRAARAGTVAITGGPVTEDMAATLRAAARELPPLALVDVAPGPVELLSDQELAWLCLALTWYQPVRQDGGLGPDPLGASLSDKIVNLRNGYEELVDRVTHLADENFGPFPVQPIAENLSAIERGARDQHRRIANAVTHLEYLRGLIGKVDVDPIMDFVVDKIEEIGAELSKRGDQPR